MSDSLKSRQSLLSNFKEDVLHSSLVFFIYVITFVLFYFLSVESGMYISLGSELDKDAFLSEYGYNSFVGFVWFHSTYYLVFVVMLLLSFFGLYKINCGKNCKFEDYVIGSSLMIQFLTLSSLIAGIYTSVTSSSILSWLSPEEDAYGFAKYGVDKFIFFFALLLFLFIRHGIITSRLREKEISDNILQAKGIEKTQTERVDKLQDFMRLMPPGNFSSQLSTYSDILEDFSSELVLDKTDKFIEKEKHTIEDWEKLVKEQKKYIRASLIALARLAGTYDNAVLGASSRVTYRANLMLNTSSEYVSKLLTDSDVYKERFFLQVESEPTHQLILHKDYSIKVVNGDATLLKAIPNSVTGIREVKDFPFDPDVSNLILPVYLDDNNKSTVYNMVGAPRAISTCHPQFIPNTEEAIIGINGASLPQPLIEEASNYFKQDTKGKSIVALPLSTKRYTEESLKPAKMNGVLNIYRDKSDLFSGDEDKFNNFFHLTSPLLVSLSRITEYHLITLALRQQCVILEAPKEE